MPELGEAQANTRVNAVNEKAVTIGNLQAPPPKSTNGGETKMDSFFKPNIPGKSKC